MDALTFEEARECVAGRVRAARRAPAIECVRLLESAGRVLATDIRADRDYPPIHRSMRDGYAVRAADLPGTLKVIGEVRAGGAFRGAVYAGAAVEIMTGAPLPAGADCVVMVEHTTRNGDEVTADRRLQPEEHVNVRGSECRAGDVVLAAGARIDYARAAMLASAGCVDVPVCRKPEVAILATGDELVSVESTPAPHQIRNSNAWSLATQVARCGGRARILPVARDTQDDTQRLIGMGAKSDLLLISGGVSAGRYDVVERSLAALGANFYFDRVLIQPGQPLVFGRLGETFFFGLPGNPASTMVCFELFARAALELLGGAATAPLPLLEAKLAADFSHKPGLTRFLPAELAPDGATVAPVGWQGSSDIAALARANAFLVAAPEKPQYAAGETIRVLPR